MSSLKTPKSNLCFDRAKNFFPGGVNSPVRAFGSVGGTPLFFNSAKGAYLYDVDENKYIDYVLSWGPSILGHSNPSTIAAVTHAAEQGLSFGAPSDSETILAELIQEAFPNMEMMRMVSSGTEACMSAIRLARGATGRNKLVKFEGCYHGHSDSLLVKAGSGAATFGTPSSAGITPGTAGDTIVLNFNDIESLKNCFAHHGSEIAGVIVEPFAGNSGFIRGCTEFLTCLRELCTESGAILIFDEVMTGFRIRYGGVQELTGIQADLVTLGKIVGGGMPLAVYGGQRKLMEQISPLGPVYQAGTLSGNPVAVAAGIATLKELRKADYDALSALTKKLSNGLELLAKEHRVPFIAHGEGGMFGFFFCDEAVSNYQKAAACDSKAFRAFFWGMLERGIYLPPSSFEAGFTSFSHTPNDVEETLIAAKCAFEGVKSAL